MSLSNPASFGGYLVFVDESGDHGMTSVNHDFPLFPLLDIFAVLSPNFVPFCEDFRPSVSREEREEGEEGTSAPWAFAAFAPFARTTLGLRLRRAGFRVAHQLSF